MSLTVTCKEWLNGSWDPMGHLLPEGLAWKECGGFGHCLYYSVATHTFDDPQQAFLLREYVARAWEDDEILYNILAP